MTLSNLIHCVNEKNSPFVHRKKTIENEKFLMSSCAHIQLRQQDIRIVYLKPTFDGEFQTVNLNRNLRKSQRLEEGRTTFPPNLPIKEAVPISHQKYNDIMSLLPFIPSFCNGFYMDLPKTNCDNRDYPASDNDNDSFED